MKILWAVKKNEPDYLEELIVATDDYSKFEKAKVWAKCNGFDRLRVGFHKDGDKPDFVGTINF